MNKTIKIIIGVVVVALIAILGIKTYKITQVDQQKAKKEIKIEENQEMKREINEGTAITEKDRYLKEITYFEKSTSNLENGTVPEQEEVAKKWNDELNKIYTVVDSKLKGSSKTNFENDEKDWNESKNDSTIEATQINEKNEMDIKMTKERCYYLVNQYMK